MGDTETLESPLVSVTVTTLEALTLPRVAVMTAVPEATAFTAKVAEELYAEMMAVAGTATTAGSLETSVTGSSALTRVLRDTLPMDEAWVTIRLETLRPESATAATTVPVAWRLALPRLVESTKEPGETPLNSPSTEL